MSLGRVPGLPWGLIGGAGVLLPAISSLVAAPRSMAILGTLVLLGSDGVLLPQPANPAATAAMIAALNKVDVMVLLR